MANKRSSTLFSLFAHPAAVFVYSLLFALVAVAIAEKSLQIAAIICIGVAFTLVSAFYLIWNERISAKACHSQNIQLQDQLSSAQETIQGLEKANKKLEAEIPKVIHYSIIRKEVEIKDMDGNADFTMHFEGENISKRSIDRIRHLLTSTENEVLKKNTNAWFNDEEVMPQVKSEQLGQGQWRTRIFLETTTPVLPKNQMKTRFKTFLEEEYKDAFDPNKKAMSSHQVALRTGKLETEIASPKGFAFFPNPEIEVRDVFTALRVPEEENRVISERALQVNSSRTKISFNIMHPRISYEYRLFFSLVELSKI